MHRFYFLPCAYFFLEQVSGVILANASLDIAFHDNNVNKLISPSAICALGKPQETGNGINKSCARHPHLGYIYPFFVGLLEADGTITTNIRSNITIEQKPRTRVFIALKRNEENINMLNIMAKYICGHVALEKKQDYEYVTLICQKERDLVKLFAILAKYPLLTARKQSQFNFATACLNRKFKYDLFIQSRRVKYENKLEQLNILANKKIPNYFPAWLSGFIEGEGNFSLVFNHNGSLRKSAFTIGQNDEIHILEWIKTYFKGETKILKDKPKKDGNFSYYRLHLYNEKTRNNIFNHFYSYPLLGHKLISYNKFYLYHNKPKSV